jgi:EAL domain-containing protein (putative c-di-GMP-specific phosphodiesterase class I)/ActR/RegA family two-component response regulator
VATKVDEFVKHGDEHFEVVYRRKVSGQNEYRSIHAVGYRRTFGDDPEYAVVVYNDVTAALESNDEDRQTLDSNLAEYLSADRMEPFIIIDADTHEILMLSASVEKVWTPIKPFSPGIKFEEFFFDPDEPQLITIEEVLEKGEVLVPNSRTGGDLVLKASVIKWRGRDAILHRLSERTDHYFDSLTGLPNLEYSCMRGEHYAEEIWQAGGSPAVVFLDFVGMKLYNNANGYEKGNELLIYFSAFLKKEFPKNLVCRIANDHFMIIADMADIEDRLNEVRKKIKNVVSKISMDLYVGVYRIEEFDAIFDATEKAKLACNIQKKTRGEFVRYYDDGLHKDLLLQNYVVSHIDEAIANGYIKIYYQPVVRTITETFCGMEALARWIDPQYGFLNPGVFIGALEDSRQIHKLDSHVIELVCRELRDELEHGRPVVPVSFNLSRLDFTGCDIFEVVEETLRRFGIGHELIRVEITESIMASDPYVQREIERFRLAGFEVWMDDFGSGYSSLNTLKDYKFDELKIDMAFLSNLNDVSRIIISSMVRMAKRLGLKTLAEGVETEEQMNFLKEIGCEKAQGYYYGKPQPLADTMKHMESTGIAIEDSNMRIVYSKLGSLDYLVDTPKSIMSYEDGVFKFLFMNKQYEEQLRSLGFTSKKEVEDASNNPQNPVYYTLREGEKMAFMSPCEMTYATRGVYVFVRGTLVADINGCHIYDLMLRNTHVSAFDGLPNNESVTAPVRTKTVLLADSNPQNRAFLESVLRADYNMLIASDGAQAHELLLTHGKNIALVLLDASLPKMDGFRLVQEFQGNRRDLQIPFVMMTDNLELAKESIRLGAYQFILKPIKDKGMIKAKVAGAIRHAEMQHQMALNYMEYVPGGVILINVMTGKILYVNARALDIFECGSPEEFRDFVGANFRNAILPEDYEKVGNELKEQFKADDGSTKQISYRTRTGKGNVKRIYHVGRVYKDTPYGHVFSAFISEDDVAMKNFFTRKDAFAKFMESGEATHTKSYDKGYKGFLFWNLTKNSPVLRMDGISYIPRELAEEYTYDLHYSYLSSLMLKSEENILKSMDYTRERLILDYLNKCIVPPLDISYDIDGYCFAMRSTFDMMMDPDSGDIVLKLVNECIKTTKT